MTIICRGVPTMKLNNRGMSLIEILVSMSIMAIMSFAVMQMISDQNKSIKTTQYTMDINEAQNQIQRLMLDSEVCKSSLTGNPFPEGVPVTIPSIKRGTLPLLSAVAPNNKIGGILVESITGTRKTGTSNRDIDIVVKYRKSVAGNSFGGDVFSRTTTVSAQFDASNNIKNCFSQLDNAVSTAVGLACKELCPTCTFDPVTIKCIRPPTPSTALYINPLTGVITTNSGFQKDGDNFCNCYNPGCPAGSSQQGNHWCTNGGSAWKCGGGRWKYGHVTCRINNPIGYLSPTPL